MNPKERPARESWVYRCDYCGQLHTIGISHTDAVRLGQVRHDAHQDQGSERTRS